MNAKYPTLIDSTLGSEDDHGDRRVTGTLVTHNGGQLQFDVPMAAPGVGSWPIKKVVLHSLRMAGVKVHDG